MDSSGLKGLSILVVEDEPMIAVDTACTIVQAGGTVVGPAYSLDQAFEEIADAELDGALLDINLRNDKVFSLADALADRGVPIVFLTGEIWPVIPERHAGCLIVGKPINQSKVVAALRSAIAGDRALAVA
ncbi:MAG TPA: response regulator [Dongiaceae bacterium]|jgi:DNA-binding response OmpR family regulator|nr:response regulator [Dongiaceae bacterium]